VNSKPESFSDDSAQVTPEIRATAAEWSRRRSAGLSARQLEEFRRWLAADSCHAAALAKASTAADDCDWM
jgi:ferric-dicitrate binding protein FerR (iron transport regulator)